MPTGFESESDPTDVNERSFTFDLKEKERIDSELLEGRFNAEFSRGCWGPKYHIAASKVEMLIPVSDYTPPLVTRACG